MRMLDWHILDSGVLRLIALGGLSMDLVCRYATGITLVRAFYLICILAGSLGEDHSVGLLLSCFLYFMVLLTLIIDALAHV